jgi:hypothetical protein
MTKFKVQLNDASNIKDLLQITYNLADEQLIQAQNEMNKLANATRLQEEVMDSKQKYSKAMNDYMTIKDKAIRTKLDIAKLMTEILTHNGDVKKAIDATTASSSAFDIKKIRKMISNSYKDTDNNATTIELKK